MDSRETVPLDDIDRLNTRDNLQIALDDEAARKNQLLNTINQAYKTSVKKVEKLVEKHIDVSIWFLIFKKKY